MSVATTFRFLEVSGLSSGLSELKVCPGTRKKAVLASSALTKRWASRENLFSTLSTADTDTQTETTEKNTRNAIRNRELC